MTISMSTTDPLLRMLPQSKFSKYLAVSGHGEGKFGPMTVSPMGFGTWAWGNQLLWGYQESMDTELQQIFNLAVDNGINLFDTADSYGTGKLNGQSEKLLGRFIGEFEGVSIVFLFQLTLVASGADWNRTAPLVNCKLCSSSRASTLGWFSGNI
ncbi:hypothetical protein L1887_08521 [Cichorium endivia]|nr:hypothetical protein L1887_08521 [Cichorium endivia]